MDFSSRWGVATRDPATKPTEIFIGVVKKIESAVNSCEQHVQAKGEGGRITAIYVPKKYAKDLKVGQSYEFHLNEPKFHSGSSGSQQRFSSTTMARRTEVAPKKVDKSEFGMESTFDPAAATQFTESESQFSGRW